MERKTAAAFQTPPLPSHIAADIGKHALAHARDSPLLVNTAENDSIQHNVTPAIMVSEPFDPIHVRPRLAHKPMADHRAEYGGEARFVSPGDG